jgi:hypothetical protein
MSNAVPNNVAVSEDVTRIIVSSDATSPNPVNVYQDEANVVIVEQDAPNNVVIRSSSSVNVLTRRYVHAQGMASTTWVITHNLGGYPSVTIVDSSKTHVYGEVQYDSTTQITLSFSAAFSGYAYLT